jgi:hypothetical protein
MGEVPVCELSEVSMAKVGFLLGWVFFGFVVVAGLRLHSWWLQ